MGSARRLIKHLTRDPHGSGSWMQYPEAVLLYKYAKRSKDNIVEIGTHKGGTTCILCKASKDKGKRVFSIDILQPQSNYDRIASYKYQATLIQGDSNEAGRKWSYGPIGLLFVDGSIYYEQNINDLLIWSSYMGSGSFIVLHDVLKNPKRLIRKGRVKDGLITAIKAARWNATKTFLEINPHWTRVIKVQKTLVLKNVANES